MRISDWSSDVCSSDLEYFEEWMPQAASAQKGFLFFVSQHEHRDAAFMLHQATERLYQGLMLTLTFYTPYNHNIAFLRSLAEGLDRRLYGIWPETNRRERAMFQKLKEAYTKARYSKLCRTRHNFDYAERPTMPSGRANALLSNNFALIGSAYFLASDLGQSTAIGRNEVLPTGEKMARIR